MIRAQLLNEVHVAIGRGSHFAPEDFVVNASPRRDGSGVLEIRYRFDEAFTFVAEIPNQVAARSDYGEVTYKISATISPGGMTKQEKAVFTSKSQLLAEINAWTARVHDEMLAIPAYRRSAAQQTQLEELIARVDELPDEYFSREEADELRIRLDELERRLRENIEAHAANQKEATGKIDAIHADVELLKRTAESLKKKGWVGSLMVRIKKWSADPENRELLKSGATVARTLLLGEGGKPHTQVAIDELR